MAEQKRKRVQERKQEHSPEARAGMSAMAKMMNAKVDASCKRKSKK